MSSVRRAQALLTLLAAVVLSCDETRQRASEASSAPKPASERPLDFSGAIALSEVPKTPDGLPILELKHVGARGLKGTEIELRFDITLRNPHGEARWFLVPSKLDDPGWIGPVQSLQITELWGSARTVDAGHSDAGSVDKLVICRGQFFEGSFQAVRLAAGATATIRGLYLSIWHPRRPPEVPFEVALAAEVTYGGKPLAARFPVAPLSRGQVDVLDDRTQIGDHELKGFDSPDELPITLQQAERVKVRVPLDSRAE